MVTRPSLLARLKDWSQTAWQEFDSDYSPLIRNVARKAGLTDIEADEVMQETLLAVAKKIGEFQHAGRRGSFRAWLYQQVRWRIADQFRYRTRDRVHPAPGQSQHFASNDSNSAAEPGAPNDAPADRSAPGEAHDATLPESDSAFDQLWDTEWKNHILQLAIDRVRRQTGARQFQLFDLHVLQGLTVRATAEAAGATMAAVFMAKSRVGRLVRREVSRLQTDPG